MITEAKRRVVEPVPHRAPLGGHTCRPPHESADNHEEEEEDEARAGVEVPVNDDGGKECHRMAAPSAEAARRSRCVRVMSRNVAGDSARFAARAPEGTGRGADTFEQFDRQGDGNCELLVRVMRRW
jgi:hypothetical protein